MTKLSQLPTQTAGSLLRKPALTCGSNWWRGRDSNPRPSGYEPDELPDCSTPRWTSNDSRIRVTGDRVCEARSAADSRCLADSPFTFLLHFCCSIGTSSSCSVTGLWRMLPCMASLAQKIQCEARMRELLESEGMPPPDEVEYGYGCI